MPMEPRFRTDVAHVLLIASDLARTSRGGLSDACMAIRELRGMVEDLPFHDDQNYYTGVFA